MMILAPQHSTETARKRRTSCSFMVCCDVGRKLIYFFGASCKCYTHAWPPLLTSSAATCDNGTHQRLTSRPWHRGIFSSWHHLPRSPPAPPGAPAALSPPPPPPALPPPPPAASGGCCGALSNPAGAGMSALTSASALYLREYHKRAPAVSIRDRARVPASGNRPTSRLEPADVLKPVHDPTLPRA